LNRRANQLANYLRELGVRPDDRVAICLTGLEAVVGILGILKAGGVYVALDSTYPEQFLNQIVEDAEITVAIIHSSISGCFSPDVRRVICIDSEWQHIAQSNDDDLNLEVRPEESAYIIFTSGSTGVRKGVIVSHQGVCNVIHWMEREFRLVSSDVVTQKSSFCFDNSVWETFLPLCKGARLIMASPDIYMDTEAMVRLIVDHRVTITHFVPVMLAMFLDHPCISKLTSLRKVLCGCDIIPVALVESFFERFPPESNAKVDLINFYGPTETTIGTHTWTCLPDYGGGTVPIGRPISNTRTYILDGACEPVPVGVTGELYIGGAGVAREYLNRPELTAERFLKDPFVQDSGARMYRTGDLGRYLPDGNIEFLGRNDFQVKIRGFRAEPGEIEARLAEHPGLRDAVVIAREDVAGDKRLVAYYIPASEQEAPDVEALRSHISAVLPEYMVPAAYVRLGSLPLTLNGKLDRKALPAPEVAAYATRSYEAPLGETETMLAAVWSDLLGIDRIGRHDNFFELGGHSLLAVRVISQLRYALGIEILLSDIFTYPALKDLALNLRNASAARLSAIVPVERGERLPVSFAQQRLWFLAQMDGVSEAYHIPLRMRYAGELNATALRGSLNAILRRHEALRTTFALVDGEPVQRIAPTEQSVFSLIEHDLRQHHDAGAELYRLVAEEAVAPFDLEAGPLIRGRLIRVEEQDHVLLITMHHIVSDGWSMGILNNELNTLYTALLHGDDDPLPALKLQYADYAVWQRKWIEGEILQQQAAYWKETLAGAPALLELPTDHVRPAQQDYTGAFACLVLDERLTAALRKLSRRYGTTLYMTLLAAWAALLSRLSAQQDVVIGTPSANRGRTEIEGLIGFFVNTLVLRLDLSGSPSVGQLLARVKTQTLAAQQNQDIPFQQVVEIMRPTRSLSHSPLFQATFAWQNNDEGTLALPGLEKKPLHAAAPISAKFDINLFLQPAAGGISGGIAYATSLFKPATIERYLGYFRNLLEAMVADDTQAVDRLPILPDSERHQLLYGWNDTRTEFPSDKCIHQMFERQVDKAPDAVAVVFENESLTYAELNRRANQLANYLRELGVKPDDRVAICVERSLGMIVAMLAVLKAGAAYVPLDPAYPQERLRFMLEDSAPVALLTQQRLRDLFSGTSVALPVLDLGDTTIWNSRPETSADPGSIGLTPQHLAYVIYTSGSAGLPKGVMVQHRAVVNRLVWMQRAYKLGTCDAVLQKTPFGFDVSVWEVFVPLIVGAHLVIASRDGHTNPLYLSESILKNKITIIEFVPSMLHAFLKHIHVTEFPTLKYVISGGEILPLELVQLFRRQLPHVDLLNTYGPTEATIDVTAWTCTDSPLPDHIPIGRPIANTRIYILDTSGQPVPEGVAGELYIGGVQVARGYLNRAELTAEKFLKDPFVEEPGARMYRTGDLARWLSDGNIEFLGRNDFQVKIRGFRIELGEIEARMMEHPAVCEAVVIAREDTPGDKLLVAYYTSSEERESPGAEQLRSHLSSLVPEYMLPAAYVPLQALPLTPNGKLDRKALPAPEQDAYAAPAYEPPQGEIEEKLAAVWADVLDIERVGRNDNFFALGGHSLLAVRVVSRLRQTLGVDVAIRDLFTHTVLTELAKILAASSCHRKFPYCERESPVHPDNEQL
jgi:amino acid adenylation domain-containing protein